MIDLDATIARAPVPGVVFGAYPERRTGRGDALPRWAEGLRWYAQRARHCWAGGHARFVRAVRARAPALSALGTEALASHVHAVRVAARREGLVDAWQVDAFATVIEALRRAKGIEAYDAQIVAARLLFEGALAEMATGEGKTLAIALGAAAAALAGIPVHVVTANDYLVQRDAEQLAPLYAALGLSVGAVTGKTPPESRRGAYRCDITYCTGKELVFDYLRDGLRRARSEEPLQWRARCLGGDASADGTLLRGLCMAIVDEADSVLLDDACVPLVLAAPERGDRPGADYPLAIALARGLDAPGDFVLDRDRLAATLTVRGRERLHGRSPATAGAPASERARHELVELALSALHLYHRDRHYVVRDGRVEIIDQSTGRVASGRAFSRGLHQLIEAKEGCALTAANGTTAQITFQQFFRRYHLVSGMSGTLREARSELAAVYGLRVARVALRRPSRRKIGTLRMFRTQDQQWTAVIERARALAERGRPVLIGTDSVAESERLAGRLSEVGLSHRVLNALNDAAEARVIACAGEAGRITVATNMAGRGTDIVLGEGVAERGGLHVISCQLNASRRIDRQLVGRCARQGDPGSAEVILSLESALVGRVAHPALVDGLARIAGRASGAVPGALARLVVRTVQRSAEARGTAARRQLLEQDHRWRGQALLAALAE